MTFAALAMIEQHLRVDTRRRVVMGYSMGGRGTWHLAAKFRQHWRRFLADTPREIELDTLQDLPYVIPVRPTGGVPIEDAAQAVERLHAMRAPCPVCPPAQRGSPSTAWLLPNCAPRCVPGSETVWQHP